jgi:hypothetical protein
MSSAVHNLQMAISDGEQSLTQLLRRTKVIAAKLEVPDFVRCAGVSPHYLHFLINPCAGAGAGVQVSVLTICTF